MNFNRLESAWQRVRDELLAERTPDGHWVGELSSSALSTAAAVSALAIVQNADCRVQSDSSAECGMRIAELVHRGVKCLARHQNDDGGFGDTDKSHSNIATTYLVVAAMHLAGKAEEYQELLTRAEKYIDGKGRLAGLKARYGIDKTFVVPIMTNLALAGLVKWDEISPLPFELAVVPQPLYRFVGMPVVSYAIPALVAIGQAHFHHKKPWNPLTRLVRWLSITPSLKVLRRMQPDSGGYLEATPLTSFVVMSLASIQCSPLAPRAGNGSRSEPPTLANEVIRDGIKFLANSIRPDGSWPIDTNLATWVTTLSINALAAGGEDVASLLGPQCLDWLLSCQHTKPHPFTGADPGGWGWSDLSGAVPDADDTAGAMLALEGWLKAGNPSPEDRERAHRAFIWALLWIGKLRNRDRGWPTFCRGWGKLPFDRSGVDLTAHAIRVISVINRCMELFRPGRTEVLPMSPSLRQSLEYIAKQQHPDGSWSPLWFGNQDHPDEGNPVYGTAKVLLAYRDLELLETPEAQRGLNWLRENQSADGGWGSGVWNKRGMPSDEVGQVSNLSNPSRSEGGPGQLQIADSAGNPKSKIPNPKSQQTGMSALPLTSSVEETALAVEALLPLAGREEYRQSVERGLEWLVTAVERGDHKCAAPIGFYFAKLWYYEKLYPIIFTASALGRACQQMRPANS